MMSHQPAFMTAHAVEVYKLKVVLVGDVSVGKTSLAIRFTQDKFDDSYKPTIGASFLSKVVHSNDDAISFQIWDTAGQERYMSLVPMYLRGAHIALIVYDVNDPETFANVGIWLDAIQNHGDFVKTVLVANKCDLEHKVDNATGLDYAEANALQYVKTSAKTGDNVDKLFLTLGSMVVDELKRTEREHTSRPKSRIENSFDMAEGSAIKVVESDGDKHAARHCCKT